MKAKNTNRNIYDLPKPKFWHRTRMLKLETQSRTRNIIVIGLVLYPSMRLEKWIFLLPSVDCIVVLPIFLNIRTCKG